MKRSSEKSLRAQRQAVLSSYRVTRSVTDETICQFLEGLNSPLSLSVWLLYKYKEHEQLVKKEIRPLDYNSVDGFRRDYAAISLLSKATFLSLPFDRKEVAMQKFNEYELLCRRTNHRFRFGASDPLFTGSNVWLLYAVKRKIAQILDDAPNFEEILDSSNWGPGVTLAIKGENATPNNKFQHEVGITRDLYSLLADMKLLSAYPLWQSHLESNPSWPTEVVGSVTVTVPKNAKTDRVISIEPGINLWFQKGIGTVIRRRLLRHGVNLNDQTVNQNLARSALQDGLATVDFSSASDSIALELVREVLPPRWFHLLDCCRSHYGTRNETAYRWEKFSSMGNGFTFELESLIFYAAACAVVEYNRGLKPAWVVPKVSVYGDDVILPSYCFETFRGFCEFLGFRVNPDKSFSSGVFYESCGSHFYLGCDVKPVYMKNVLTDLSSIYRLANAFRLFAHRSCSSMACDADIEPAFHSLVRMVPDVCRFRIPYGLGDGGFISNFDESAAPTARTVKPTGAYVGIEGYIVQHVVETAVTRESTEIGLLLARLRSPSHDRDLSNNYPLRGRVKRRVARSLVPQWYDLGPWL